MRKLEKDIVDIYRSLLNKEFIANQIGDSAHPSYRMSAINLVRYITLRNEDLRKVHDHLSDLGISSLRSCEGYVMRNVTSVLRLVKLLNGESWEPSEELEMIGYKASKKLLRKHSRQLFNTKKREHIAKIMVTMPSQAADDPSVVRQLIIQGMEIARIDLSQGTKDLWQKIAKNVKAQSKELKQTCLIYMDLSGPKISTENIDIKVAGSKRKDFIKLNKGDHLILSKDCKNGEDSIYGKEGVQLRFPTVGVSLAAIIDNANIGDRVLFDDGKIESIVLKKNKRELEVVINTASTKGIKLKSRRGINLPDSKLVLPSLTETDRKNLPFIVAQADIVGYSYVRTPDDVKALFDELNQLGAKDIGVVLKIENQASFENLPLLLLEAMKRPRLGVMIAKGDLAVDIGPERITEVQDQIMWICEAAHIPVIWATQVLEDLTNTGKTTRAEISDAAKTARAECVMLNKGKYLIEAVSMLSKILHKMEGHTSKKKNVMRALKISQINLDKMNQEIVSENSFEHV